MSGELWFKVVENGRSCSGGSHGWSLPAGDEPGGWHDHGKAPVLCESGFHVTRQPAYWMGEGRQVYVAEIEGRVSGPDDGQEDATKVSAERCRLLRPATAAELAAVGVYTDGNHLIPDGVKRAHASGSATVRAYDSATVRASGSATVEASGSATVEAYDSATVRASGSATVEASGSATVRAYDSATVRASGSATVRAYDSATVRASGSATVEGNGRSTTIVLTGGPKVSLADWAAEINWASGWAEFRRASGPTQEAAT